MCDSMVASCEMTKDGQAIFAKSSDRSCNEPQYFVYVPAADHPVGMKVRCTLIEVEQVPHTNAMILSKPSWIWGCEMGVNEFGVCIGNESVFSKEMDTKHDALLGMDICRLALERAKTAREAVEVMGGLMETYGQGGNASFDTTFYYDNAYLVTDPKESWHFETAGNFWAAKKVSGSFSISNYLAISTPDLMHKDLVNNAIEKGYPVDDPFDFAKAYIDWDHPINISGMIRRTSSYRSLQKPGRQVTVKDVIATLRSHNTDDPWTKGGSSVCMHAGYLTKDSDVPCQTCNSMIAVLKPGDITMWGTGMSTTCIAPFQPFWFDAYSRKQVFAYNAQEDAMDSWLKREKINRVLLDGRLPEADYKAELDAIQNRWLKQASKVAKSDRQILCDKIAEEVETFFNKWIKIADSMPSRPLGGQQFQLYWKAKNATLGKNRTIAY